MTTKILDIPFSVVTNEEALHIILNFLADNSYKMIFTPNPEVVMQARNNPEFKNILIQGDLIIPDGIGIVMASKLNDTKITERVAGCDLAHNVFDNIKNTDKTVYLFGGAPGVADAAKKRMTSIYPGLKIVGTSSGYFDANREKEIINEINTLRPDLLLVGLGMVKQEKWIFDNRNNLNVKVAMGVGGTIDVMSGKVERAPEIFINFGMEWFYRLMKDPKRISRMGALPKFAVEVIKENKRSY